MVLKHRAVAFYLPMNNKYIDNLIQKSRSRMGTTLASVRETRLTFENYTNAPTAFLMIADQSPSIPSRGHWINFMHRETSFLHGPEKHARINNLPLIYIDIQRVKYGYYEVELSVITEKPLELPEGEPTRLYAQCLEKSIHRNPESWLWSHRRWKHSH